MNANANIPLGVMPPGKPDNNATPKPPKNDMNASSAAMISPGLGKPAASKKQAMTKKKAPPATKGKKPAITPERDIGGEEKSSEDKDAEVDEPHASEASTVRSQA